MSSLCPPPRLPAAASDTHLVRESTVAPDQHVAGNSLAEHLDLEGVGNDLLRLPVDVGVHERDIVVARDHVTERRETLLDTLDGDTGRERVAEVLELLVGGGGGHEEAVAVAGGEAADDAGAGDGRVDDGDDVGELGLEDRVEVGRRGEGREAVANVRGWTLGRGGEG